MPTFRPSPDLDMHYEVDDFTDPWLKPETILALEMNGRPLAREHGFPLRSIVPGYIGARSVKWLGRIVVSDHSSENNFVARDYKLFPPEATPETVSR
jgi:sulfite oxidase